MRFMVITKATAESEAGVLPATEDFDTMGGLVLSALGRAPDVGDEVNLDGYTLRVEETDGPRVAQVVVREHEDGRE